MRCPKSRFPIQIIVFGKLELIIFVSQGLTLSTASLVNETRVGEAKSAAGCPNFLLNWTRVGEA